MTAQTLAQSGIRKTFSPMSLTGMYLLMAICVTCFAQMAAGQTSAPDTLSRTARSTIGISATVARDTLMADSLRLRADSSAVRNDTVAAKKDTLEILTSNPGYNTIPGYRVQLMSTQNLSEAIGAKAEADSLLQGYNIYIVYDSPYYKVRVGDFRARYEANQAVAAITDRGFPNAWAVPDNVFRNPPRKSN